MSRIVVFDIILSEFRMNSLRFSPWWTTVNDHSRNVFQGQSVRSFLIAALLWGHKPSLDTSIAASVRADCTLKHLPVLLYIVFVVTPQLIQWQQYVEGGHIQDKCTCSKSHVDAAYHQTLMMIKAGMC